MIKVLLFLIIMMAALFMAAISFDPESESHVCTCHDSHETSEISPARDQYDNPRHRTPRIALKPSGPGLRSSSHVPENRQVDVGSRKRSSKRYPIPLRIVRRDISGRDIHRANTRFIFFRDENREISIEYDEDILRDLAGYYSELFNELVGFLRNMIIEARHLRREMSPRIAEGINEILANYGSNARIELEDSR